ncbi:hypothetical protein AYM40_06555 [Paraburkholderia phytofirmans OLGA172]|uniref:Uncharacterized protein n=1 Tax=Paraburkholderia phytofirmans OLGA172 TaxID=1417228 RepID=A0A160FJG8_9BURK|nr:hypothetical protein AYM40_06555 [Paraburkholderia phytofirmans OLGA172]
MGMSVRSLPQLALLAFHRAVGTLTVKWMSQAGVLSTADDLRDSVSHQRRTVPSKRRLARGYIMFHTGMMMSRRAGAAGLLSLYARFCARAMQSRGVPAISVLITTAGAGRSRGNATTTVPEGAAERLAPRSRRRPMLEAHWNRRNKLIHGLNMLPPLRL